ncbi:AMP-binding protein, partial [Candidatus Woesearchaeota archaeon]|nr:AMP-binding protein [Candidatus Woesearchaeota archaeon]
MTKLIKQTVAQAFDEAVKKYSKSECAVYPEIGLRWTYEQLYKEVTDTAKALLRIGIGPKDHVSVWASNLPEWLVLQFATAKIGAVLVTVNTAYREKDLEYLLSQSDSKALFLMDKFKSYSYVDILNNISPEIKECKAGQLVSKRLPKLKTVVTIGKSRSFPAVYKLEELKNLGVSENVKKIIGGDDITEKDILKIQKTLDTHDVINIQYTSGTTGFPKGAMLTSYGIVNNSLAIADVLKFKSHDKIVLPNPLFHCFGSIIGTLLAIIKGGCVVFPNMYDPTKFEEEVLKAINDEKCTVMYGTPSHFDRILKHPKLNKFDLKSLRTGIIAGAPCPLDLMEQIEKYIPEITIAYGSTELSPIVTQTRINDPREIRLSTVGKIIDVKGMHIKLVNHETGEEIVNTETGNYSGANTLEELVDDTKIKRGVLWSKGPQVMKGYYNKPSETAKAIINGWYDTGDIGTAVKVYKDKKKDKFEIYFKITGREKDMIITGGENIYPAEIENVVRECPRIFDVAVYGVPDEEKGEVIGMAVIPQRDAYMRPEDVVQYCVNRGMRKNYIPRPEFIEIVENFPMTVSG